jgi:hypothetical protein
MTRLPCVLCGRTVSPTQVQRNRTHTPPLHDNLCKSHAKEVSARAQQLTERVQQVTTRFQQAATEQSLKDTPQ